MNSLPRWSARLATVTALFTAPPVLALSPQEAGPEEVVQALFAAARNGAPLSLAGYCHPALDTEPDVIEICALTADSDGWAAFVEWFGTGTLTGPVEITEGVARVPFRFGPDGDREEIMELHLWGERWYLRGF